MTNKNMKRSLNSLIIREMQSETGHYDSPIRLDHFQRVIACSVPVLGGMELPTNY